MKIEDVLSKLEAEHLAPWRSPYLVKGLAPANALKGNHYSGFNAFLLSFFGSHFLTYKQAKELGCFVKAGSKALPVFFFSNVKKQDKATGEDAGSYTLMKSYSVFSLDQIEVTAETPDHIKALKAPVDFKEQSEAKPLSEILDRHQVKITRKLESPSFYKPSDDSIHLAATHNDAEYNQVLAHELIHWTGTRTARRERFLDKSQGAYAREELIITRFITKRKRNTTQGFVVARSFGKRQMLLLQWDLWCS